MTKQLAPIEELALATGLILKTTNLELCPSYLNKLEQLRQAIIRDFVSTLEPRAYVVRLTNSVTDVLNWEIPDKNWRELGCKAQHYAPLYELPIISEWKAK